MLLINVLDTTLKFTETGGLTVCSFFGQMIVITRLSARLFNLTTGRNRDRKFA